MAQKRYGEAELLLRSSYEGMKQREKQIPPESKPLMELTINWLAELYQATGQFNEANEWKKRLTNSSNAAAKTQ